MRLVALIVALGCFVFAALLDFELISVDHPHVLAWIACGLVAFVVAHLVPPLWREP